MRGRKTRALPAVGLIPAAGHARRLGLPSSSSKEVYPVAGGRRVVSDDLVESLAAAGVETLFWILRRGKWDVVERHLSDPAAGRPRSAFLVTEGTASVPETLDRAYPFVRRRQVVVGFPDVLFRPLEAAKRLLDEHRRASPAVSLALFPSSRPDKTDMVSLGVGGRVERLEVKPGRTELRHTWILAAWGPAFTEFLHRSPAALPGADGELAMSRVFEAAIGDGLEVRGIAFEEGEFLDIGTPEDLRRLATGRRWRQGPPPGEG